MHYLFSFLIVAWALIAPQAVSAEAERELVLLNWSDYMDPEILKEFQAKHGVKVKEVYFDSDAARNELLLETEGKGYDLAIVDGTGVRVLAKRGWLDPIAEADMPNLRHIYPRWRNAHEKAKDFAVPYFWGTMGIAYRRDLVAGPITRWMQLLRPDASLRGRIAMVGDPTDLAAVALKALGYSLNSEDKGQLAEAEALLQAQRPYVKTYRYIALSEDSALVKGDVAAAVVYSGDGLMVKQHSEDIEYVLPEEGSNIWVDYLCILSASANKVQARQFIDFLNEPTVAARLAEFVYYASPNRAAEALLPREHLEDPVIYPSAETLENSEFYRPLAPRAKKRRQAMYSRIVY